MALVWRIRPDPLDPSGATGAQGIVNALHAVPYGAVWTRDAIAARRNDITAAGFTWDVVKSLPVHEDIKRGSGDLEPLFANYRQSLANLAAEGVKTVCYNFVPILDWTRTDLTAPAARGGTCLHFSAAKMAAFEIHMLGRAAARDAYHVEAVAAGGAWFAQASEAEQSALLHAIMSGLPGAYDRYDMDGLRRALKTYDGITADDLGANLARFLTEVIRTAAELGISMCIHPDNPPRDILGLPRIVSSQGDIELVLQAVDEAANGLTLCTGSLGSGAGNDLPAIACAFGDRVHFVHLRNVTKSSDGSFSEAAHLDGDVDLVAVFDELLEAETRRSFDLPIPADHRHALLSDAATETQPGYTLIGRL